MLSPRRSGGFRTWPCLSKLNGAILRAGWPFSPTSAWPQKLRSDAKSRCFAQRKPPVFCRGRGSLGPGGTICRHVVAADDGRYPVLKLILEQQRQRTLEGLVSQMEALARQKPVLMIFEDAHWTDPTSLCLDGRQAFTVEPLAEQQLLTSYSSEPCSRLASEGYSWRRACRRCPSHTLSGLP